MALCSPQRERATATQVAGNTLQGRLHSLKRWHTLALGQIAKKRKRCQKWSRRYRKLQGVGSLFIGNPHGVRNKDSGRHYNQRMSQWEYDQDMAYLAYQAKQAHIESFNRSRVTKKLIP